ncbi:MAG: MutS-related protein [Gemmataceae bacterium]
MEAPNLNLANAKLNGPREVYLRQAETHRERRSREERLESVVGNGRLAVFLVGLLIAWMAFGAHWLSPWWIAVPATAFLVLLPIHDRVNRAIARANRAIAFCEKGLARVEERWAGTGQPGTHFLDEAHPYAPDLDLFGKGSLFELLSTARTGVGEKTLAWWLLNPASPQEIRLRQTAVAELRPHFKLRENLALLGADIPSGVKLDELSHWAVGPRVLYSDFRRWTALALALLTALALLGWLLDFWSRWPFFVMLPLEGLFAWWMSGRVNRVLAPIEKRASDLMIFSGILQRLERGPFVAPWLTRLQSTLQTEGRPPSDRLAQLVQLIDWLNAKRNQFFTPLALMLLWDTQFAFAIEAWRSHCGAGIPRWLDAVGQFEALSALATYSYENPQDPFPVIVDEGPVLDGEKLGHPLLPRAQCVPNDLLLTADLRVLVVSGSNMSGKSTYLRTAGLNAVLAQAGAPVRAARLRMSPLAIGATLRIQDSLQAGRSRFYAEITRVRQLVDVAKGPLPLLFLLDEIFHGTNSHDRRLGAEGVVRSLIGLNAIGLITTHDLALAEIADHLSPQVANVHFEDQMKGDEISFDYRVHPGVVQHSNALALMRAVGLEV